MKKYAYNIEESSTTVKCKVKAAKVSFKNTHETSRAIIGKTLDKAIQYLNQVIKRERCVPMVRYAGGVGRTAQAKEFKAQKGRWPVKSCNSFINLIKNLKANGKNKNLDVNNLVIKNVVVNQAPVIRGRVYRAHGRINRFDAHPCHIQMVAEVRKENVPRMDVPVVEMVEN